MLWLFSKGDLQKPLKVVITGAAGQIAYSLFYPVARGDVFGSNQVESCNCFEHIEHFIILLNIHFEIYLKLINIDFDSADKPCVARYRSHVGCPQGCGNGVGWLCISSAQRYFIW